LRAHRDAALLAVSAHDDRKSSFHEGSPIFAPKSKVARHAALVLEEEEIFLVGRLAVHIPDPGVVKLEIR
jgi:hypothetical protein